uniref:Ig-like domain-containing protein n=1 Tax=Latimeria chalumnae TaxID=7897 RepID=H3AA20_LATCH
IYSALFLTFLVSGSSAQVAPSPVIAQVGTDVILPVRYTGDFFSLVWYREPRTSDSSYRIGLLDPNGNYFPGPQSTGREEILPNRSLVLTNYTGNYTVTILAASTVPAETTELKVYKPISKPTISSNDSTPMEFNDTVTLTCFASGIDISYQWWRDNQPVSSSGRWFLCNNNQTLTISKILRTDNGPYTCNSSNAISTNSSDKFFLNIRYGPELPKISISPNSTELSVGSAILFSCVADSNPPATFTWFLNNMSLNENGQNLTITKIQQNNTGNYSCQAFNSDT